MNSTLGLVSDRDEWLNRANIASNVLDALSTEEFYSNPTDLYHPVRHEIAVLVWSLHTDAGLFGVFLSKNPQTKGWLPDQPSELQRMSPEEVKFRLGTNIAGERWVAGALRKPFQSGTLKVALDRLIIDFDKFPLEST
jgi:hypothetical protein